MSEFINLDKFTKQVKIGKGAFGKVFKVIENSTKNIFAAKISKSELNQDDSTLLTDLKNEVNILSQLNHKLILRFIGYSPIDFNQKYHPVIITEYSANKSLEDILELDRKHTPPEMWTDTKKLINIYGIASAMSYLHSYNIIHCDLKPANILEDDDFYPKIADFGLSVFGNMTSQSKGGPKGTPIYMAPEIWSDMKYLKAGDVYAFGIIVYEILTLREPFKNYNRFTLLSKVILNGERPKFGFPIPKCYRNLITKCWSANPEDRPTFQEIVEEIRTNKEFIIDTIDEREFFEFVDFADAEEFSFEPNKKFKTIISKEENNRLITVGKFNSLPLKKQQLEILDIIENIDTNEFLLNINNLLIYLLKMDANDDEHYFYISEDDDSLIEEICTQKMKIKLLYSTLEVIVDKSSLDSSEFSNYVGEFEIVNIDIKYPTASFEKIYEQVLKLKKKYEEQIEINISIDDLKETDMRFRNDEYINSIVIDNNVIKICGDALINESIGGGSFSKCSSLAQITLPNTLTEIGEYSFYKCSSLTQIMIPSSTTKIGEAAFLKCSSLSQVIIPSSVTSIKKNSFSECSSLKKITIPSSVTSIEESAFSECSSLTQITIPSSITSIGHHAFSECSSLTQITIPSSLTSIEKYLFNKCSLLRRISIPSSITSIGNYSFYGCSSLTQITIPSSISSIKEGSFAECSSLAQITIPSSVTSIKERAFLKCSSLTQITIPSSVTSIGEYAFSGCSSLTQVTIPSSITSIEESTFSGCTSLTQITIPSSVTSIGNHAFLECSSLTQISIPSSVILIKRGAFWKCSSLAQITIPSSVTLIDYSSFSGCSSLTQITIPSSITSIRSYTFSGCTLLTQITIPSSVTSIEDHSFKGCSSLIQITIPSSVTSIGDYAFLGCSSLTQITIPSSVTSIGNDAFSGCSSLTQISIPSSITSKIESDFCRCLSLMQITIPSSETDSELPYFYLCRNDEIKNSSSLTQITILSSVTSISLGDFSECSLFEQNILPNNSNSRMKYDYKILVNENPIDFSQEKHLKNIGIINTQTIYDDEQKIDESDCISQCSDKKIIDLLNSKDFKSDKEYNQVSFASALKGAKLGEKYSKCLLGYFIAHGIGTKKDFNKGVSMMIDSNAEDYYDMFATDFGLYYLKIKGDENKAFIWFEKAFNLKPTKATINNLGICYLKGIGVTKNISKAKDIFNIGIDLNDANSMYHLGFILKETDPEYSQELYKKAAKQNNMDAQASYAYILSKTKPEKSIEYFKLAADKGHIKSQEYLGNLFKNENQYESMKYLNKAAINGSIKSLEILTKKYIKENDTEKIYLLIHSLTKTGNYSVPIEYAINLYKAKKYDVAYKYFSMISDFNHPIAKYFIGIMNYYGQGCIQNKKKSYEIMKYLSDNGIEKATDFIESNFAS